MIATATRISMRSNRQRQRHNARPMLPRAAIPARRLCSSWPALSAWMGRRFLRYDSLAGSVIEDSPLVRRSDAISAGLALSRAFKESIKRVVVDEVLQSIPRSFSGSDLACGGAPLRG